MDVGRRTHLETAAVCQILQLSWYTVFEGSVPLTPGRSLLLFRIEQLQGTVLLLTKGPTGYLSYGAQRKVYKEAPRSTLMSHLMLCFFLFLEDTQIMLSYRGCYQGLSLSGDECTVSSSWPGGSLVPPTSLYFQTWGAEPSLLLGKGFG